MVLPLSWKNRSNTSFVDHLVLRIKLRRCDTGRMADKKLPKGVVSEEVVWHEADGTPTTDKLKAASAEVTTTYADGRTVHRLLRSANNPPTAE